MTPEPQGSSSCSSSLSTMTFARRVGLNSFPTPRLQQPSLRVNLALPDPRRGDGLLVFRHEQVNDDKLQGRETPRSAQLVRQLEAAGRLPARDEGLNLGGGDPRPEVIEELGDDVAPPREAPS